MSAVKGHWTQVLYYVDLQSDEDAPADLRWRWLCLGCGASASGFADRDDALAGADEHRRSAS